MADNLQQFADRINTALETANDGSLILFNVSNGNDQTEVSTDSGNIPSIDKFIADKDSEINEGVSSILAQTTAESARAEQAVEDAKGTTGLGTINDAMADNSPENISWDVDISFNNGIEMKKGYGNLDSNGNRSVDFSRASTSGNINKSNVTEEVGVDEPLITGDNSSFYEVSNLIHYSNNINVSNWEKTGVTVSTNLIREDTSTGNHDIQQQFTSIGGESYCFQCRVKPNGVQYVRLGNASLFSGFADFDIINGTVINSTIGAQIRSDGDGFYIISLLGIGIGTGDARLTLLDPTGTLEVYTGDGVSEVEVQNFSISNTTFTPEYIETTSEKVLQRTNIPATNLGGYSSFQAYTNSLLESEAFDQVSWFIPAGVTVTQDGTLSSDGVTQAWLISATSTNPIQNPIFLPLNGEPVTMYQEVKAATSKIALLKWIEFTGGTLVDREGSIDLVTGETSGYQHEFISVKQLNDGWWGVWWANTSNNTGNTICRLDIGHYDVSAVSGSIYASKAMIIDNATGWELPYVKTVATPNVRASDNASITMVNNMPDLGEDFTIMVDGIVPTHVEVSGARSLFRSGGADSQSIVARRTQTHPYVFFELADSNGVLRDVRTPHVDGGVHRYVFRYKDGITQAFVDGVGGIPSTPFKSNYDLSRPMYIGRHQSWSLSNLNGSLKNFRIIHEGLTDNQITALGGAI